MRRNVILFIPTLILFTMIHVDASIIEMFDIFTVINNLMHHCHKVLYISMSYETKTSL